MFRLIAPFIACLLGVASASAFQLPESSTQCVVGISKGWDDSHVTLALWERSPGGAWQQVGPTWSGRLGKSGLVWGRGIHPLPSGVKEKREGDMRAPAGVFSIGGVWGAEPAIRKHPALFYRQVTPRDLWVEDPSSPHYNRHLVLDHDPKTSWEKKQQMKQNDPAHKLKLFIAHNAPPKVVPNAGSSIFFHIWRAGGDRPSAGCTTMAEAKLRWLIARIDPARHPLYVLLPESEYQAKKPMWGLP